MTSFVGVLTAPRFHLPSKRRNEALPEEFPLRVRVLKQFTMNVVFAIDNVLTDCFLKILVVVIQAHLLAPLPFLPNVAFVQTWCITPYPQTIIPLYSVIIELL
jgi:hypothetical protein